MSVIKDMTEKASHWHEPPIIIHAPAEKLKCSRCGKEYVSRGKHDIGVCRECEKEQNAMLIGGVYDGEKAYDQK